MKVLITGASGFVGLHLLSHLSSHVSENDTIFAAFHSSEPKLKLNSNFIPIKVNIEDPTGISLLLERSRPDIVIHLAARTKGALNTLIETNIKGIVNLLEPICRYSPKAGIILVSSSSVYGYAGVSPICEKTPVKPVTEYGLIKSLGESVALYYQSRHKLRLTIIRPFNIIGPGISPDFALGTILNQVVRCSDSPIKRITIRAKWPKRDYIDVRDVAGAIYLSMIHGMATQTDYPEIFNVGSGVAVSLDDCIDVISSITKQNYNINETDPCYYEPIPLQICDFRLIKETLGWSPSIPLEASIDDSIKYIISSHLCE